MTALPIEPAAPADLAAIFELLAESGLPCDGLADHVGAALVARAAGEVVGSAAIELYGGAGLLRSVAVAPAWRGRGLGRELTAAALDLARARGVERIYLLTTTAETYFPRLGFAPIERGEVDAAVQVSAEFTGACPASAAVLRMALAD